MKRQFPALPGQSVRARLLRSALSGLALIFASVATASTAPAVPKAPPVRLYVLDCGFIKVTDPSVLPFFGVTLADLGGQADMPVSCYLIRHGDQWMMFDAGNGDWRHAMPPEIIAGMVYETPKTLADQLKAIGVAPADVRYLAISHVHLDHVGNVAMLPKARLLIQRKELEAALAEPAPFIPAAAALRLTRPGVVPLDGDEDVFGDGSVTLLSTPGHTPGHQSLLVRLPRTGPVILTGDLYHYPAELRLHKISDHERATEAPASRARIEALAQKEKAQIWIGHDLAGVRATKKAPDFYE